MPNPIEYKSGQKFPGTRLSYLHETARQNPRARRAIFICSCGNQIEANIAWVVHHNTTSCGCYRSEQVTAKNTKHSQATRKHQTGAYRTWQAMHNRVSCQPYYAGKRTICDRWSGENGFQNFYEDMGDRPKGYTIERIDNDGNYEPSNCKWATRKEQANNHPNKFRSISNGKIRSQ